MEILSRNLLPQLERRIVQLPLFLFVYFAPGLRPELVFQSFAVPQMGISLIARLSLSPCKFLDDHALLQQEVETRSLEEAVDTELTNCAVLEITGKKYIHRAGCCKNVLSGQFFPISGLCVSKGG